MIGEFPEDEVPAAAKALGDDARPTGLMRLLRAEHYARLQCKWAGSNGSAWVDLPVVRVDVLPPLTEVEQERV